MRNRTWKMFVAAALLGPAVALVGCSSDGQPAPAKKKPEAKLILAQPVEIVDSTTGDSKALKNLVGVMLIKSKQQYDKLGDDTIAPGIDFEKHDLVIAALGEQPTGGYSITIDALQLEGDKLVVVGKASAPAADASTIQALTYPYAAAVIENTTATRAVQAID